jgi:DNA modification methylase
MMRVTEHDFNEFVKRHKHVTIGDKEIPIGTQWNGVAYGPPKEYVRENETVWSFPNRGDWATHTGNYRGNWSPYIPRNLILKYTQLGDLVLDQMVGSGTTLVECKLLGRNAIGVDINRDAIMVARDRINFSLDSMGENCPKELRIETYVGDARKLHQIETNSIDLIVTHPPYAGIISYTKSRVDGDLSSLGFEEYFNEMKIVADEAFRVLRPGKMCAILIGDTRKHLHYVPISLKVLGTFLEAGFILKEDIIKLQYNTEATRTSWRGREYAFYKIAHEHLYVLRKSMKDEKLSDYKYSLKWW